MDTVSKEGTPAEGAKKGVLRQFVEEVTQQVVDGKVPVALIAVYDQQGHTTHSKLIHKDGNRKAAAGELSLISIQLLLEPERLKNTPE